MEIGTRISELLKALKEGVYEKDNILAMSLLCAVAGESIFLLGPPGTAKSLVARRLKMIFKNGRAFEYLMSRFSTPDEIFGPVSISKLKNEDCYERVVEGFLPTATVVFLDEIWKAGPAIQNSLLTAINEKIYHNGHTTIQLPMKALIAASNELPAENEGLEALWDRFLVRMVSNCIQDETIFYKMIRQKNAIPQPIPDDLQISEEEYEEWQRKIDEVEISDEICYVITYIRNTFNAEMKKIKVNNMVYYISDRRWKRCVHLLQTSAFLHGRKSIDLSDIPILIHCLWNKPESIPVIIDTMCQSITAPIHDRLVELRNNIVQALNNKNKSKFLRKIDEDDIETVDSLYYKVLNYPDDVTLFFKMDYSDVPSNKTCDGIIYFDETKHANIIHAIKIGQLNHYIKEYSQHTKEIRRIKLSKYNGGIIIDDFPYDFQTKTVEPTIFNLPDVSRLSVAQKVLNEIRNELSVKLSDLQDLFDSHRNLFLTCDDITLVKRSIADCKKELKEMEIKAQNACSLL